MKNFIIAIGLIAALIFIFLIAGRQGMTPPFELGSVHPLDRAKGSGSVIIVEYSDFQCPACRNYYPIMRELFAEFKDKAIFVYRHFPLSSIHPNADIAARASEAAGKQGKFWEMHDLLFEKQAEWSKLSDPSDAFESYAKLLGISVEQFKVDINSDEVKKFVKAQKAHAIRSGLSATPTFFVNGEKVENPRSVDEFRAVINEALKSR